MAPWTFTNTKSETAPKSELARAIFFWKWAGLDLFARNSFAESKDNWFEGNSNQAQESHEQERYWIE